MEFTPQSTAIDFAHYSEFPDEYGTSYLETASCCSEQDDEDDDGFSSSRLDIQEELLRGADFDDQLEMNEYGEEHEEEEEQQEPSALAEAKRDAAYWQSGSSDPSSYSTDSRSNGSQAVKRSYASSDEPSNSDFSAESESEDEEECDGGRRTKRARMESDGKEWKKRVPAYLLAASTEMLRIRFPFQSLSIRLADFLCLQDGELLNDTIIDFYLNHIVEHLLPDEPDRRVTVLPSVFWHNLSLRQTSLPDDVETMTEEEKERARFEDILDFVADFDLIDVDYVVVPVNEWEHWSLAVVCHPFTASARVLCFDSQLAADPNELDSAARLIAQFFQFAYVQRRGAQPPLPLMEPLVPERLGQQENHYDCGLFMLEYARRFLLQPPAEVAPRFDFAKEYPDFTVEGKRTEMQRVILSLCPNRALWEKLTALVEAARAQRC